MTAVRAYVPSAFDLHITDRFTYEKGDKFIFIYGDGIVIPTSEFNKMDSISWVKRLEFAAQLYEPLKYISDVINAGNAWDSDIAIASYNSFIGRSGIYYAEIGYEPLSDVIQGLWHGGEIPQQYRLSAPKPKPKRDPEPGYIYLLQAVTPHNHYKIGLSKTPVKRIESMGVKLPFPIEPVHVFETDDMPPSEKALHDLYADKRVDGEWFDLTQEDVDYICSISGVVGGQVYHD